jgi:hypothetical protein
VQRLCFASARADAGRIGLSIARLTACLASSPPSLIHQLLRCRDPGAHVLGGGGTPPSCARLPAYRRAGGNSRLRSGCDSQATNDVGRRDRLRPACLRCLRSDRRRNLLTSRMGSDRYSANPSPWHAVLCQGCHLRYSAYQRWRSRGRRAADRAMLAGQWPLLLGGSHARRRTGATR